MRRFQVDITGPIGGPQPPIFRASFWTPATETAIIFPIRSQLTDATPSSSEGTHPSTSFAGRTPKEFAASKPEAEVVVLADVRKRRLERRPYAHGILRGYALVADAPPAKAA